MIDYELLRAEAARHPYPLLFATISGAHLYGFPSPDSDYDLRGAHILPAPEAVGLLPKRETIEVGGLREGVEMDLVTHDVLKFFLDAAQAERLCIGTALFATDCRDDTGARRVEGDCVWLHYSTPQSSLHGIRRDAVGSVAEGRSAARQAAAVRLSRDPDRDLFDANGSRGSEPDAAERGVPATVCSRFGSA